MKQFTIFILLYFYISGTIAQKTIYFDEQWKECSKTEATYYRIINKKDNLFLINDFYISGKIQFEGKSKTDKDPLQLEGEVTFYLESGQIASILHYQDNKLNGKTIQYYSNGQKKREIEYLNNQYNGDFITYFPNGKIAEKSYVPNNKLQGESVSYVSPDVLEFKGNFNNGEMNGAFEFYNNGKLQCKGIAKDGLQEGLCYEYDYSDGYLSSIYTIHNKMLDGYYYELNEKADTICKGFFNKGVPINYVGTSTGTINGSIFSFEMILENNIEKWRTYRDGKLILESFYSEGMKTGIWKMYTMDGKKLYETKEFLHSKEDEKYLQCLKDKFDPRFFLSPRFNFNTNAFQSTKSVGENIKYYLKDTSIHINENPFYWVKKNPENNEKEKLAESKWANPNEFNYEEFTNTNYFKDKNNCTTPFENYSNVHICVKQINGFHFKILSSFDEATLLEIKNKIQPKDDEIVLLYMQFKDGIYRKDVKKPNRYMSFALSESMKDALKSKIIDDDIIIYTLEHLIFDVDKFSGLRAGDELEKEYGGNNNQRD